MKQVLQSLRNGTTELATVPRPAASRGHLLIRTSRTLISAGTERMLVNFARSNLLNKARQQPDRVRMAIDKARTDGIIPTLQAMRSKLDQPLALGYCNVGIVTELGVGVTGFSVGDRVASNGQHAEFVSVPVNLCAKVPAEVSDDNAAFTVVAAIALEGIRLVQPTLGEAVVVMGLGLIGLLSVQLLRAHGCRVLGIDFDTARLALARSFGAETVDLCAGVDAVAATRAFSRERGADAVLVTAATQSSEPMHQAAEMSRQRGRIVLVGITGLDLSRDDFYKKELTFQVSCSYGPGRYDPAYEGGQDYPLGFVRWTAQRNFEAFLDLLASGRIEVEPLITHRFPIERAAKAYELFFSGEPYLGVLLTYPKDPDISRSLRLTAAGTSAAVAQRSAQEPCIGLIGAGNYASVMLLPSLKKAGAALKTVAASGGLSAAHNGRKFGFEIATSDPTVIFSDPAINSVFIATRHDSHARLVLQSLRAGKHVFAEKPLCLTLEDLAEIESLYRSLTEPPLFMVGFNRRFAPQVVRMREMLSGIRTPKSMVMLVNAGFIPSDHWTQDREIGGGRIIGEACHFIDLLRFLAGEPIERLTSEHQDPDSATITLSFAGGSTGTVHYLSGGHRGFPKERLTVLASGRVLELDNFRQLTGWGWLRFSKMRLWKQDKGHNACVAAFLDAVRSGAPSPIPFDQIIEVSRIAIQAAR